jgi:hypothetical protein
MGKLQDEYLVPGKMAIIYHGPGSLNNARLEPGDERLPKEGLQFPHLNDEEIKLLKAKRILIPAPKIQKKSESVKKS